MPLSLSQLNSSFPYPPLRRRHHCLEALQRKPGRQPDCVSGRGERARGGPARRQPLLPAVPHSLPARQRPAPPAGGHHCTLLGLHREPAGAMPGFSIAEFSAKGLGFRRLRLVTATRCWAYIEGPQVSSQGLTRGLAAAEGAPLCEWLAAARSVSISLRHHV